ncbi:MAG TPA: TetR/AcrR family transcriptional regulator [Magnetospirillaceae bacterium]|jgi:AcrR family transcriptional regulator
MTEGDNDSKTKMVRSAATLFSTRGIASTSFSDVLADSGAPRGSIYHHFPEGKAQLAEAAVSWVAQRVAAYQRAYTGTTTAGALERFISLWRSVVTSSQGGQGCALAGVTIDTAIADRHLLDITRAGFRSWIDVLADQFAASGIAIDRARAIATMVVAGLEGALILCRAEGSAQPLDTVAGELMRLLPTP